MILARGELLVEVDEVVLETEGLDVLLDQRSSWRACSTWTLK